MNPEWFGAPHVCNVLSLPPGRAFGEERLLTLLDRSRTKNILFPKLQWREIDRPGAPNGGGGEGRGRPDFFSGRSKKVCPSG